MMKSLGIVRAVDSLGRIVIPIELRRTMGIEENDALEIFVDDNKIVLKKYAPGCNLCGSMENLVYSNNKPVCIDCINRLQKQALLEQMRRTSRMNEPLRNYNYKITVIPHQRPHQLTRQDKALRFLGDMMLIVLFFGGCFALYALLALGLGW